MRKLPLLLAALALGAAAASVRPRAPRPDRMSAAAAAFLDALGPLRAKAAASFADPARTDWKYVPADRQGVCFADMNDDQRRAARDLLRTALSSQGVLKVEAIITLESVLRDLENNNPIRDPGKYVFRVFGTPGDAAGWAWKFEGHHVSLNFTLRGAELVGATPLFLGSNPGELRAGPFAGRRTLAAEEDLGRDLVRLLTDEQRRTAILSGDVPADVLSIPGRPLDGFWPAVGLPVSAMTAEQRTLVVALLQESAGDLRPDLAEAELVRLRAGLEDARFAWAGPVEPGNGHYYRLVGPSFVLEYDNTQNNANHVHVVWHDRQRDFGGDPLREHLAPAKR